MAVAPSRARLRTITAHVASNEKEEERQARQAALQRRQMEAVVKIFVRSVDTSYSTPWQKLETESSSGSGFAISGRRVLTNAHVVNNCNSLRLQRPGRPGQWEGKVLCIARQCDLALVSVAEDSFWEGLPLLQFSNELPALDTSVTAIGYPVGGDNLAITRGVVSRVDLMDYTMLGLGDPPLVVIQIDAAINPGNSGGPVFDQHLAVCGVAFAGRSRSNSVGYVIPASVVELFLASVVESGRFSGLPSLGVGIQSAENFAMKKKHGLAATGREGVVVTKVAPGSSADGVLRVGDVILAIGGEPLGEDGSVQLRGFERISFAYLITSRRPGQRLELEVGRASEGSSDEGKGEALQQGGEGWVERLRVEVELKVAARMVPRLDGVDAFPAYLIVGGLVFVPLSVPFLDHHWGWPQYSPPPALAALLRDTVDGSAESAGEGEVSPAEEVVILAKVLPSDINFGYQDLGGVRLLSLNGTNVSSLRQLARQVAQLQAEGAAFLEFALENQQLVVLDGPGCQQSEQAILSAYGVPAPQSEQLLE